MLVPERKYVFMDPFEFKVHEVKVKGYLIDGEPVEADGYTFTLFIDPDGETTAWYEKRLKKAQRIPLPEKYLKVMKVHKAEAYKLSENRIIVLCETKDQYGLTEYEIHEWHKRKQ